MMARLTAVNSGHDAPVILNAFVNYFTVINELIVTMDKTKLI